VTRILQVLWPLRLRKTMPQAGAQPTSDVGPATLLKPDGTHPALARLNSAPAPPLVCPGVMESAFVSWPTSFELAVFTSSWRIQSQRSNYC